MKCIQNLVVNSFVLLWKSPLAPILKQSEDLRDIIITIEQQIPENCSFKKLLPHEASSNWLQHTNPAAPTASGCSIDSPQD